MKYLFLDTSSSYINIAVVINNVIVTQFSIKNNTKLSENIFIYIEDVLYKSNIKMNEIDKIYIVNGPGSFTGIRVGLTIAKVAAWTLNIPIVPVSTLEFYATTKVNTKYIIPIIKDRNDYIYAGIYNNKLTPVMFDKYLHINELLKKISENDKYTIVSYDDIDINISIIKPELNILKIIDKYQYTEIENVHLLKPNYLKMIEAERNLIKKNDKKN